MSSNAEVGASVLACNHEAEGDLLGGILCEPKEAFPLAAGIVTPQDFYLDGNRDLFVIMGDLFRRGIEPEPTAVRDAANARGDIYNSNSAYLAGLMNRVATGANVVNHAKLVRAKSRLRQIQRAAADSFQRIQTLDTTPDCELELLQQRLAEISSGEDPGEFLALNQLGRDLWHQLNMQDMPLVTTGITWLDDLSGGWKPGDLWIWAGRTNSGKSKILIWSLLRTCMSGAHCGLISLDMAKDRLTRYILKSANTLGGNPCYADPAELAAQQADYQESGKCYFCPSAGDGLVVVAEPRSDCLSLERYIRVLARDYGCKVIAIDQAQNFREYQQGELGSIGAVVHSCKEWARMYNVCIILVHQVNRDGYVRPTLRNLKDSSVFAEYPDFVVLLHDPVKAILDEHGACVEERPGRFRSPRGSDTESQKLFVPPVERAINLDLAKSRHGETGGQAITFDFGLGIGS